MATAINNGTFTFNKEELTDISKVIKELTFGAQDLSTVHDVVSGIKHDTQIVFASKMGRIGKTVGANCTPSEISGITLSEKTWTPKKFDFRLKHCSTDVNTQDKLINQWARVNDDFRKIFEGSNSAIGNFLIGSVQDGLKEELWYKAWFQDTANALIANGGVMTAGSDIAFDNTLNGIFKQIFTTPSLTTGGKYYVNIAKNAGNSYANQELTFTEAIAVFKGVYKKADNRLKNNPSAQFLVTQTLYDGLLEYIEDKQTLGGFTNIIENGQMTLTYRGYKIVKMDVWDRYIDVFQNTGTKWNLPHRMVFTVPTNIPIGTPDIESLEKLNAFYDQVTMQNYVDGVYGFDAKLLEDYLTCVAY